MLTPPNARARTRNSPPSAPPIVPYARELVVFFGPLGALGNKSICPRRVIELAGMFDQ